MYLLDCLVNIINSYLPDITIIDDEYITHYLNSDDLYQDVRHSYHAVAGNRVKHVLVFDTKTLLINKKLKFINLISIEGNVKLVGNMIGLFMMSKFNGNISHWDTSELTSTKFMFAESDFNNDISAWDTKNLVDTAGMFMKCDFNNDLSRWNTSSVTNMDFMFYESRFNGDISNWDTRNVTSMIGMFTRSYFTGDLAKWNMSSVNKGHEYL